MARQTITQRGGSSGIEKLQNLMMTMLQFKQQAKETDIKAEETFNKRRLEEIKILSDLQDKQGIKPARTKRINELLESTFEAPERDVFGFEDTGPGLLSGLFGGKEEPSVAPEVEPLTPTVPAQLAVQPPAVTPPVEAPTPTPEDTRARKIRESVFGRRKLFKYIDVEDFSALPKNLRERVRAANIEAEKKATGLEFPTPVGVTKTLNEIAISEKGKPFSKLTNVEQKEVRQIKKTEKQEEARLLGGIRAEAEVEKKLKTGLPAETAGKLALLHQATKGIGEVESLLFPDGVTGGLNRTAQIGGFFNVPVAMGRQINSRIKDAIEAKLRIETGAAATQAEVERTAQRFIPIPFLDDDAATADKLRRLREFMQSGAFFIDPTGRFRQRSEAEILKQGKAPQTAEDFLEQEGF